MSEDAFEWARQLAPKTGDAAKAAPAAPPAVPDMAAVTTMDLARGQSKILVLQDASVEDTDGATLAPAGEGTSCAPQAAAKKRPAHLAYDEEEEEEEGGGRGRPAQQASTIDTSSTLRIISAAGSRRRNTRRKTIQFSDEPKPLVSSADMLPAGPEDFSRVADDEDIQMALAKTRRANLGRINYAIGHAIDPAPQERATIEGTAFTENDFIVAPTRAGGEEGAEQLGGQASAAATGEQSAAAAADAPPQGPVAAKSGSEAGRPIFVEGPLIRRGVGSTLELLRRLGIRLELNLGGDPHCRRHPHRPINLDKYDEEGNLLSAKEAYKELSHRFHGKTPGKGKKEKQMRQRQERQRVQTASWTDTPLGTAAALREHQRSTGSAHIVLAQGKQARQQEEAKFIIPSQRTKPSSAAADPSPARKFRIFGMQ